MIECKFENGQSTSLRHVVVDALVMRREAVLLVKRARHLLEGEKWGLVGGFVERDETTKEAVVREVREETGWRVSDVTIFRIKDSPNRPGEDRQNYSFVCICTAVEHVGQSDAESDDQRWWSLANLPSREHLAFDHADDLELYRRFRRCPFGLPVMT